MSLKPAFHRLRAADLRREAPDAVSIAFDVPGELAADYRFEAGQYLTLRTVLDGEELRRSYSICAGPDDGELRIAVKRVEGGAFSAWANGTLAAGDWLDVMTPVGRFGVAADPGRARVFAGFAAGSGITPILSIVRGILSRETRSRFFLFYGSRSTSGMLFREALGELKDRHLGRLSVLHVLSREQQDLPMLDGRLDAAKVRALLRHVVPAASIDHAFVCGPAAMAEEIDATLRELGVADIHVERFVSAQGGRPQPRPELGQSVAPAHVAALIVDGNRREVGMHPGETVLDAALRAGMDLPFACRGGMCSTCRAQVTEGAAEMLANYSLEPWETQAGFVLTCQAVPKTARITVDYDRI